MTEQLQYKVDPLALSRLNICNKCKHSIDKDNEKRCSLFHDIQLVALVNVERIRCPIEKW